MPKPIKYSDRTLNFLFVRFSCRFLLNPRGEFEETVCAT